MKESLYQYEPGNEEVSLSSEQPHLHLHLCVKMTQANPPGDLLLAAVLLHLPDGVQEEQNEDSNQDIEVIDQLGLKTPYYAAVKHLIPHSKLLFELYFSVCNKQIYFDEMKGTINRSITPISM